MIVKVKSIALGSIGICLLLTFVIPTVQFIFNRVGLFPQYDEVVSSIFIIVGSYILYLKIKNIPFLPSLYAWKILCLLGSLCTIFLVLWNVENKPISQITGQARCALSVINVIILLPVAEELIFRGHMWSFLERASVNYRLGGTLLGTSFLFGIGHLGYWLQFYWPLPIDAVFHSLSMIFAGFCLGLFRWFSNSILASIIIHAAANGFILFFQ